MEVAQRFGVVQPGADYLNGACTVRSLGLWVAARIAGCTTLASGEPDGPALQVPANWTHLRDAEPKV